MKIIFVIFLILFSSLCYSHDKGKHILYKWETSSGNQWKFFGDEEIHDKYEGEIKNNKPNGLGIFRNKKWGWSYIGEWERGKYNGKGKLVSKTMGLIYEGEWKNGKRHGHGTDYSNPSGDEITSFYIGSWKNGKYHGEGTWGLKMYNKMYKGEFRNGHPWNVNIHKYNLDDSLPPIIGKIINGKEIMK